MERRRVKQLLRELRRGKITVAQALERLRDFPFQDLGFANLDTHRSVRRGFPEVVYCPGKRAAQIASIIRELSRDNSVVLATRATREIFRDVKAVLGTRDLRYFEMARMIMLGRFPPKRRGLVLVVTAGTTDIPVAEEAALTAQAMGARVQRLYDVGVSGVHRLLDKRRALERAKVIVVVAGMEGALPSVVSGLVDKPVIAVPTSVGYGASFDGLAALLAMMTSCSPGVATVNIDNGFGAGYVAALINARAS